MSQTYMHYSQASSLPSDYGIISSSYSSQRTGHFPRHLYERHQQRPDDNPDDTDALDIDEQLIDNARLGGGLEPDSPSSQRRTALNDRDQFSNSLQVPHRSPRVIPRISPYAYSYTDGSPIAQNYRGSTPPFVPSNLPISPGGTPPPPRRASITIAAGAGGDSNENTPLLRHRSTSTLVPRIQEDSDSESDVGKPKWTSEFWILGKYTLPVFGTHLLEYSLVLASVVSIGHLSTVALAASTLGSMTASVTAFSIIQGLASALDTLLPSAWTSQRPELVGLWSLRMAVVMGVTIIPILAIWFNSENILLLLKQEPEVAHLASVYLKWVSIGLPAYAFNNISRRYFQSQGLFTLPTRIIIVVSPINVLMNYLLVWGPPAFRLGFIGAPISTAISFNLISILSLFFIFRNHYSDKFPRKAWHPINRRIFQNLGILVRLGLAGVGQTASEWWSWELIGLAASLLGPVSLATQSVLLVSSSCTYQAPFALSVAVSVRIGNLLGEGNAARARLAAYMSLVIALGFAAVASAMFLIFRNSWAHIFNDDPEVVALVAHILPWVALFQVFDGLATCTGGILRARGKQMTGAILNLSAYYVIGVPFGLWLAFKRDLELAGLWIGLSVSLFYCAAVGCWLCLRTDWDVEVEKVMRRVEEEEERDRIQREAALVAAGDAGAEILVNGDDHGEGAGKKGGNEVARD
ncbi:MATE efflux family protein [Sistotremastrum suecicum HHB10207 ss-3]|uniref:MATE efflux family protein n=1 Tax=Sistotremastrum suecicum HHB10207 ss-3 TaxID=1314776 RepID=A0A166ECZ6_9AGAM|nr:MATE efflux family protein [Sistotremastrum suecicum HHB10207 ss-3]